MFYSRKMFYLIISFFLACTNNNSEDIKMEEELTKQDFQIFLNKNIYFGHQSVGSNIISGIKKLNLISGIDSFIISDLRHMEQFPKYFFAHSPIGKNGDPQSKIDEFKNNVEKLMENNLGIAIMKFCYVDITRNTNIDEIFNYYVNTIDSLKLKYKDLSIFHSTVPLLARKSLFGKLKDFIKGNKDAGLLDNQARNLFNKKLLTKYSDEIVFDLAKIESTFPNGKREFDDFEGEQIFFLINDYTNDGGHLNDVGQALVAEAFIKKFIK